MDPLTLKWLREAITFSPQVGGKHVYDDIAPLKDTDVVRVYHGFYDNRNAVQFCKYGASGKELASRVYSYESNNNPYGLFVTSNFDTAKEFSRPSDNLAVIIEFHASVKDLEAPVWPSGGYTVQGQMAQYWKGDSMKQKMADREKGREKEREKIKSSPRDDLEFAKKSDKPELAKSLFYSGEYQALFVGDLNPNSIRAVWVYEGKNSPKYETFTRMKRNEFLKKYSHLDKKHAGEYQYDDHPRDKIYKPTEDWMGMDDFITRYSKKYRDDEDHIRNTVNDFMKTEDGMETIFSQFKKNMWPKQIKQAIKDLGIDDANYFVP